MRQAIVLGLIVAMVGLSAVAVSAQQAPVPCHGDAARCHTGSFTLYSRGDNAEWIPQKPYGISEGDCRTWAVIITELTKTASSCMADDHHIAYVYFPDGHWGTVAP